jgi:hypothetical protein
MTRELRVLVIPAITFLAGLAAGLTAVVPLTRTKAAAAPPPSQQFAAPKPDAALPVASTCLGNEQARYHEAIARAKAWLDTIQLDRKRERELALGPYKKLVELITPYVRLYRLGPPPDADVAKKRIAAIVAPALAGQYLDLATATDEEFSRDSTSYLRAGYLIEEVGLDATRFRASVAALRPRLDADLVHRGAWQLQAFAWYYAFYGLPMPAVDAGGAGSVIGQRADPYQLPTLDVYALAHEVFIPYRYGELRDVHPFGADDMAYLRLALTRQEARWIMDKNDDLIAELLSAMSDVGLTDEPELCHAVLFLLAAQRPDGSWGVPPPKPVDLGRLENEVLYLHSTNAAMLSLMDAFDARTVAAPAAPK